MRPGGAKELSKNMDEQHNGLTEREAAKYLGVSASALRLWRARRSGPNYYRPGSKLIRYRRSDLDGWIEERLCIRSSTEKH